MTAGRTCRRLPSTLTLARSTSTKASTFAAGKTDRPPSAAHLYAGHAQTPCSTARRLFLDILPPPPRTIILTTFEAHKVCDTTLNSEPHLIIATVLNASIEVEERVQSLDIREPEVSGRLLSGPTVVSRFFIPLSGECSLPTLASSSLLDQGLGLIEGPTHPVLTGPTVTGKKAMSDDGTSLPLSSPRLDPALHTNDPLDPPIHIGSHEQAWRRLIGRAVPQDELPSLIETIFSDRKTIEMVDCLQGSDTQAFIDVIDEVSHHILYPPGLVLFQPSTFCLLGAG